MSKALARESIGRASLASRASTIYTDFPSDDQRPEDLTNEELFHAVEKLKAANRQVQIENGMFETYLKRMEPQLLVGFDKLVEQATAAVNAQNRAHSIVSTMLQPMSSAMSMSNLSMRRGTEDYSSNPLVSMTGLSASSAHKSYSVMKFGTGSVLHRGPRMNLSHKMEMAGREMEELRISLEAMQVRSKRTRAELRAQLEQLSLMIKEVKDSDEELTRNIIVGAVDGLTHTIPAERFVRHMEEWLKRGDSMVEKLRLKTSTLRSLNIRVQTQLVQKLELGETLHPVDFDQLQIENREQLKKVDQKNRHLLELKKMTGKCNQQKTNFRHRLFRELRDLKGLHDSITSQHALIDAINDESITVAAEVDKADDKLQQVKNLRENFMVPDTIEYATVKTRLTTLRKQAKVWTRRLTVQHTSLVTCVHALQKMTPVPELNLSAYLRKATETEKRRASMQRARKMMMPSEDQMKRENVATDKKRTSAGSLPRAKYSSKTFF